MDFTRRRAYCPTPQPRPHPTSTERYDQGGGRPVAPRPWYRKWFCARSLLWHFLLVVVVGGCSWAAWWQWHRAAEGNVLSYLYSVEWPAFAIIAVIGWWLLIQEPPEELAARKEQRRLESLPKAVNYDAEVLRRELAAHPELVRAFPQIARAYPELAGATTGAAAVELPAPVPTPPLRPQPEEPPGDSDATPLAPSAETQAHNDMLAAYAAAGR
ncbi:MAG: hypothetical protein ACYC1D_14915, partial [Acidimicrobiales bacterium]